jgi:hypothetical protein
MEPAKSKLGHNAGRHIATTNRFRRILSRGKADDTFSKPTCAPAATDSQKPKIFGPKFAVSSRPASVTASSEIQLTVTRPPAVRSKDVHTPVISLSRYASTTVAIRRDQNAAGQTARKNQAAFHGGELHLLGALREPVLQRA